VHHCSVEEAFEGSFTHSETEDIQGNSHPFLCHALALPPCHPHSLPLPPYSPALPLPAYPSHSLFKSKKNNNDLVHSVRTSVRSSSQGTDLTPKRSSSSSLPPSSSRYRATARYNTDSKNSSSSHPALGRGTLDPDSFFIRHYASERVVQYSVTDIEKNNKRHLSTHFMRVLSSSTSSVVEHFYNVRKNTRQGMGKGSHRWADGLERKSVVLMEKVSETTFSIFLLFITHNFCCLALIMTTLCFT
jgi:hypothetical protein